MKITLQINGREQSFSEAELIAKLEKLESLEKQSTAEVAKKPTEGKWFEVNPNSIDQNLFKRKRKDPNQEAARKLILEAFEEVNKSPDKYSKSFKTMMPEKTWEWKTVRELKKMACEKGDHIADWVEQCLEWAQRIKNGESWEDLCNKVDTTNWYRLVVWKNGYVKNIGGSRNFDKICTVTSVSYGCDNDDSTREYRTVPLIVLYK